VEEKAGHTFELVSGIFTLLALLLTGETRNKDTKEKTPKGEDPSKK
jgi:hypothetical protein